MAQIIIEIEYVCPLCGAVSIEPNYVLVRDSKDDIHNHIEVHPRYCISCEASFLSLPMDVARVSVPEKNNFGASLL
jgi:hypothetical protein